MTSTPCKFAAQYRLVGISDPIKGRIWHVNGGTFTVGRGRSCDLRLVEPCISRVHCELTLRNGALYCRNRSASGVVLVNGEPVEESDFAPGDELAIGSYAFILAKRVLERPVENSSGDTSTASPEYPEIVSDQARANSGQFPSNSRDVYLLFRICRQAAACDNLHGIFELLVACVRERFPLTRLWFLEWATLYQRYRTPVGLKAADDLDTAPLEDIARMHNADKAGFIQRGDHCVLVCPIVLNEARHYVLAFETPPLDMRSLEQSVLFCAILGQQIGSIALAVEAKGNSQRSLETVSRDRIAQGDFKGQSRYAEHVRKMALKAAATELPVLVLGDTGVGKDIVARSIHSKSARSSGPFVVCNCPAIPPSLFETEMFGHVKGAFTGADAHRKGLFELADGGSIFLDEVGDLGLEQQSKLLRVLESGVIRRVGGANDAAVDVRIITAANSRLVDRVSMGTFREDLFHRLCGIEISIPALRDRVDDIPLLAQHFLLECAAAAGGPVRILSEEALSVLRDYEWPGNVRELRQVIGRSYALAESDTLDAADILLGSRATHRTSKSPIRSLAAVEREHIAVVLEHVQGNKSRAAELLGIGRDTLRRKIHVYNLQ